MYPINPQEPIQKEIFRSYDIRGVVGKTLTPSVVYQIGQALGTLIKQRSTPALALGRDGRLSGASLSEALAQGVLSTGCNVIDIGQVPTPLLYFATHHLGIPNGVMITGSHNPSDYNGLKMVIDHQALHSEDIQTLYQLTQAPTKYQGAPGQFSQTDLLDAYLHEVLARTSPLKRPLSIVVDAGNGVAGAVAPRLYQELGCSVIPLFCEVDGHFPNHHPDPGQPQNLKSLQEAVLFHKADLGLAFDGDGDRLGVIDDSGKIIWPDRQLLLFAQDLLSRYPKASVLFDVKCSRHLSPFIQAHGGTPLLWKTGHSLIKAKMRETGALLGGEMSGHFFFKERWFGFDDALYAGAQLLSLLSCTPPSACSAELFAGLPESQSTPELQVVVPENKKFVIMEQLIHQAHFPDGTVITLDGLRVDFPDGFGLIRPSNTTPCFILRFEGDDMDALQRIQIRFKRLLLSVYPEAVMPF